MNNSGRNDDILNSNLNNKSFLKDNQYSIAKISNYPYIRVIPQGTVDNNQGPDRLVGPKDLDPNYSRQPTL